MKIIRVYMDKRFLLVFRFLMLLVALFFLAEAYKTYATGESFGRGSNHAILGESSTDDFAYYAELVKEFVFGVFFIWLGTLGSRSVENK